MTRNFIALHAAMLLLAGSAYAAKPNQCTNPRLKWELRTADPNSVPSKIIPGDGAGLYEDGKDGVKAIIEHCGNGFADATLDTGSTRKITFNLGAALGIGSSWSTTGSAFLRIGNIRANGLPTPIDPSQEGQFTTWMTTTPPSPKRTSYKFRMFNPDADFTGELASWPVDVNDPLVTAKVNVLHCPANPTDTPVLCPAGLTKETWFVYPDPTPTNSVYSKVGTLVDVTRLNAMKIVGQFEAPFYFVISIW